jgi:hypothetical protein
MPDEHDCDVPVNLVYAEDTAWCRLWRKFLLPSTDVSAQRENSVVCFWLQYVESQADTKSSRAVRYSTLCPGLWLLTL